MSIKLTRKHTFLPREEWGPWLEWVNWRSFTCGDYYKFTDEALSLIGSSGFHLCPAPFAVYLEGVAATLYVEELIAAGFELKPDSIHVQKQANR